MKFESLEEAVKEGWMLFEGGAEKALTIGGIFTTHKAYGANDEALLEAVNAKEAQVDPEPKAEGETE
jgi:hypothetical protein